jgi:hypothetical protein
MNNYSNENTHIKYFTKNNDDCLKITVLNNYIPVKLRGMKPKKEYEICYKENPELFNKLCNNNKFSNK